MRLFKRTLLIAVMIIAVMASVFAQDRPSAEEMAKKRAEKLKTELSLNDEQASAIEQINLERTKKLQSMRAEMRSERAERAKQMREVNNEYETQLLAVLDADQKAKYETIKEERMERTKERRGRGDGEFKSKKRPQ